MDGPMLIQDARVELASLKKGRSRHPNLLAVPRKIPPQDINVPLESKVEAFVAEMRRRGKLASDEKSAWSVYNIKTGEKLVSINEDAPMQAASMIKPFVAAAFFHKVQEGKLHYGKEQRRLFEKMITVSTENWRADKMLELAGGPAEVDRILRTHYGSIFRQTKVVEYMNNGQTYRNTASAHDYSRFLLALRNGELPHSDEILRVMKLTKGHRVADRVSGMPKKAEAFAKTGTTSMLCGAMSVINVKDKKGVEHSYTLVGIIEKEERVAPKKYEAWASSRANVIRGVSAIAYRHIEASDSKLLASNIVPERKIGL